MKDTSGPDLGNAGDQVLQQIGILSEATAHLDELEPAESIDPDEVGKWITSIGRALAAIFKI